MVSLELTIVQGCDDTMEGGGDTPRNEYSPESKVTLFGLCFSSSHRELCLLVYIPECLNPMFVLPMFLEQ